MHTLMTYLQDGADYQAKAVLAYLQDHGEIEESWNDEYKCYDAEIQVARWMNGREQGYVVMLPSKDFQKQLNIAFFEHRNSDHICAVRWEQCTFGDVPTIHTAEFKDAYTTKWDVSKTVDPYQAEEMASWITDQFVEFWKSLYDNDN